MTKSTEWPCRGCGAPLSGRGGRRYCGPDCRPLCSVDACEKPVHSRALCSAHLSRAVRHGDPLAPLVRNKNVGPCGAEGCERPMRKAGLCANHYQLKRYHGEVREPSYRWALPGQPCVVCAEIVEPGQGRRRHCSDACQVADSRNRGDRPKSATCDYCGIDFPLDRARTGRLQRTDTKWCPDCGRSSPDVTRFRRYGITKEWWARESARGCQICGTTDGTLHVDHDHKCCPGQKRCCGECVRGLLCGPCNRGIGLLRDDYERVAKAAAYLAQFLNP